MSAIRERDGEFFAPEHRQPQDWDRLAAWLGEQGHDFAPRRRRASSPEASAT